MSLLYRLSIAFLLSATTYTQALAQCTIAQPAVKLNSATTSTVNGNCQINLDLYFDMQANSGGKYVYIHIWPTASYPTLIYNNPPTAAQLANSVATLGFYHFGSSLYMLDAYAPDPTISNYKFTGMTITKGAGAVAGSNRFTIQNITISAPGGCATAQSFVADVWQSQSASAQNVHCFSRGLKFFANDPGVTGFLICEVPRKYRFQIKTIDPLGLTVNYKVYIDNGDGIFNATTDIIQIASGSDISLNSSNNFTYNSGLMEYAPYSSQKPEAERALWVVVSSPTRDNEAYARLDNNCALLPIQFGSFEAKQLDNKTALTWTTLSESDNRGFEIERNNTDDPRQFRSIGFMNSQSANGNSVSKLTYQFLDPMPVKQVALYRIKQIDYSGKSSYSPTRRVNGFSILNDLFPNPANDQVNLVFSQKSRSYEIEWVNDLGQRLGRWTARDKFSLPTTTFSNGVHRIRIRDLETGQSETRTILINHLQ